MNVVNRRGSNIGNLQQNAFSPFVMPEDKLEVLGDNWWLPPQIRIKYAHNPKP
jgi:hypothetical protein